MELRRTEETVHELSQCYEAVRRSTVLEEKGLVLPKREEDNGDDMATTTILSDLAQLSETVTKLSNTLTTLQPKVERFRQRLEEKDPITKKNRYGEKTHLRVQNLVDTYDFLCQSIPTNHDENNNDTASNSNNAANIEDALAGLLRLQQEHAQQLQAKQQQERKEEQERLEKEEAKRKLQEQLEQEQKQQLEAEQQRRAEEEAAAQQALRQQAEAARQRRLAQQQAEQEWMDSIPKGPQGVKQQLQTLKESTKDDAAAQTRALSSLYTIFQQINAHPEETKFRRIRKGHEGFHKDIGRHKGGVELLIAAGFELGAIDDVPCYLSKEPDIENDMDGWSAWFDLLKATLEILEQEQK